MIFNALGHLDVRYYHMCIITTLSKSNFWMHNYCQYRYIVTPLLCTNHYWGEDNMVFTNSTVCNLNMEYKDRIIQTKCLSVTWPLGVLYSFSGHPSSPLSLICVIAQMNQCHRCWEHLLSTLAPRATALMDTNYKISAPWGDIAQALPHSPEGVWSGQCVCVCLSVLREQ